MILKSGFFKKSAPVVAKGLLGKYLARKIGKKTEKFLITETEAYEGLKDKASHASRGLTKRNAPMFGEAGRFYVYFVYGAHYMLNVVTGPKNYPAAVLIRATAGVSGPGRLTKKLKIDKKFNDKIAAVKTGLWIENNPGFKNLKLEIKDFPRVGVDYAGPVWSHKKWRFILDKRI